MGKTKKENKNRRLAVAWGVLLYNKIWDGDGWARVFKTKKDAISWYPEPDYKKIKVNIIEVKS